jgi:hypothetical protein
MIAFTLAITLDINQKLIDLGSPFKVQDLGLLLSKFVVLLLMAAGIAAFFYLLLGGLQWITSGGDKAGVEAAREKITAAIIGLVIVACAWALFLLLQWFFGFNILGGPGGTGGGSSTYRCSIKNSSEKGQVCDNPNRCDINGGCNIACCAADSECVGPNRNDACNISNGYCWSGKSCGPK